jgi:ribosomal protein S6
LLVRERLCNNVIITLPVYDQQSITILHNLSLTNKVLHYYITCLWPTKYYIMTLPVYDQQSITLLHNLSLTNNVLHYYITCLWPTKYYITCLTNRVLHYYITCLWPTMYYIITLPVSDQQCITLLHYLSLTNNVLHYLSDQQHITLPASDQ